MIRRGNFTYGEGRSLLLAQQKQGLFWLSKIAGVCGANGGVTRAGKFFEAFAI